MNKDIKFAQNMFSNFLAENRYTNLIFGNVQRSESVVLWNFENSFSSAHLDVIFQVLFERWVWGHQI